MPLSVIAFPGAKRLADRVLALATPDPSLLGQLVTDLMLKDNRDGLLAGLDKDGLPMARYAPLKPATWKRRPGPGPILSPQYAASRFIDSYIVSPPQMIGTDAILFTGSWPGVVSRKGVPLVVIHADGTRFMAARPINGIRPGGLREIATAFRTVVSAGLV